ncbi:cytidine deaminase [Paenibacillus hexagrammi]|uniref:Cytidine deaminase n=1 Tax=Paenibacillus hexagrammi TaxID=2908839 RepID=A0ABY3ST68_9BACL|nr:cytidine deaminase [Paenibacillus sp. YPD9-1]UJF36295.1 cytidine deaminase [Paenibacillus sp. YPD9-1]
MNAQQLLQSAAEARNRAYTPYSHFKVGAALLGADGQIHMGCNIENAAYGPTNCAERTALFRAVADGHSPKSFHAIAVIGDTEDPIAPCGVCRQVLVELCRPDMPVYLGNLKGEMLKTTVAELLPGAFTPKDLQSLEEQE